MGIIKQVARKYCSFCRNIYLYKGIQTLKNEKPTIICQNCYTGIWLHDYNMEFRTPTINIYFTASDFIKFCNNLEEYIKMPLEEVASGSAAYPIGKLNDIIIHLVHYDSFDEANKRWIERCNRIDLDNLYFMMTDRDDCTYQNLIDFDKLKCKNKVVFVHRPYPEIKSACYVLGYENESYIGNIYAWKGIFGKRIWDKCDFDFVKFIKGNA